MFAGLHNQSPPLTMHSRNSFCRIANLLTSVREISKTSRTFLPHYPLGRSSPFSFPIYYSLQDDLFQVITSFKMAKILQLLFLYKQGRKLTPPGGTGGTALQGYERVRNSRVELYERVAKSFT